MTFDFKTNDIAKQWSGFGSSISNRTAMARGLPSA
jgi:hypothetical protein